MVTGSKLDADVLVTRSEQSVEYNHAIDSIIDQLDHYRGAIFSSNFEFPGRYTSWDIGFINPPLVVTANGQSFKIEALNSRGTILLRIIIPFLSNLNYLTDIENNLDYFKANIKKNNDFFIEEERSKQPSVFSILRIINSIFMNKEELHLGLYGAFGYDLVFQFDSIELKIPRDSLQRDLVLYLPDEIYVVNHRREVAHIYQYDFSFQDFSTQNLPRTGKLLAFEPSKNEVAFRSMQASDYVNVVKKAKKSFEQGELFEVVPGQSFFVRTKINPSILFKRLRQQNPSPYGFFINLGESEYLVGASPEMFVRVNGKHIETRPISGTIARGKDPLEDANQILKLLNSAKDEAELTMCTDVDRNDKSRICIPGSVQVTGRREIEMYSRLIHTVDHVEGILRPDFDSVDAFLTHMWVVTVTGAPKLAAMQFIEQHETSPRCWYGGAIGWMGFNGNINTGLTIRTIQIRQGVAQVRVGASVLYDSDPIAEEEETQLKASALLNLFKNESRNLSADQDNIIGEKVLRKVLLVDHKDSFVHTLANYFRQGGVEVITIRSNFLAAEFDKINPDLVVLSPGPGSPKDFDLEKTIQLALDKNKPIFGVCLGLQGIIEYFGGVLKVLEYPMHGKKSLIKLKKGKLFKNIDEINNKNVDSLKQEIWVGRYHSLYVSEKEVPSVLEVTAVTQEGVVMAIEHKNLPIAAVQFHPESIMSLQENIGYKIIKNVIENLLTDSLSSNS